MLISKYYLACVEKCHGNVNQIILRKWDVIAEECNIVTQSVSVHYCEKPLVVFYIKGKICTAGAQRKSSPNDV